MKKVILLGSMALFCLSFCATPAVASVNSEVNTEVTQTPKKKGCCKKSKDGKKKCCGKKKGGCCKKSETKK